MKVKQLIEKLQSYDREIEIYFYDYVGTGQGIDRYGYTEMDYLSDRAEGGNLLDDYHEPLKLFVRNTWGGLNIHRI